MNDEHLSAGRQRLGGIGEVVVRGALDHDPDLAGPVTPRTAVTTTPTLPTSD
ncbi:hypothetical protein [Dactylosporangium cerinum]